MSTGTIIVEEKLNTMPLIKICQLFREIEYWHEEGVLPSNSLYKQLLEELNAQYSFDCKDWLEPTILFVISKKYVEYAENFWKTSLNTRPYENN